MSGRVTLTVQDGIGQIVLDRPDKMNAITPDMTRELQRVCREIDDNRDIRVATIAGAGERAFSAGSDLNTLVDLSDMLAFRDRIEYAALVRDIRKPVIAALKGWVLGGGMEIAIAADIRVAGRSVKIGGPEVTRGWLGGGGASQMLPRLVGVGQAMHLLLTGDPVDAETALRIGLVEEVVEDADVVPRTLTLAQKIASFSPVATQAVKAAIRAALSMPLEQRVALRERVARPLHVRQGAPGRDQGFPGKARRQVRLTRQPSGLTSQAGQNSRHIGRVPGAAASCKCRSSRSARA